MHEEMGLSRASELQLGNNETLEHEEPQNGCVWSYSVCLKLLCGVGNGSPWGVLWGK